MSRPLPPEWADWAVPAAVVLAVLLEIAAVRPEGAMAAAGLGLGGCLALVGRRRWPVPSGLVAGALMLATPWFGPELDDLAAPILVLVVIAYSLARWIEGYGGVAVLGALLVLLSGDYLFTDERNNDVTDVFFVASLLLPPYVLGRVTRKLAKQSAQLIDQQESVKREAVRAERERIARELHDVIAHSVSAMVVQTAAAQDVLYANPTRAEQVLADVAATGRQALAETGRLLHVIRDEGDELGLEPAPGLDQLTQLVDRYRTEGLDVELHVRTPIPSLPPGVDVSAYRIVQEALTNALRYGAGHRVSLTVSWAENCLRIRSSNPCNGHSSAGSGLGLLGMAERVAILGGTLTHGVTPQGRFELDAALPVTS